MGAHEIITETATAHNLDPATLMSRCRRGFVSKARHEAMHALHTKAGMRLNKIAAIFGVDRTSVYYACLRVSGDDRWKRKLVRMRQYAKAVA